ncbi:MAG: DNA polymerase III subunit beta [Puniceicoccales bacterium]|jgi:DNA polymerase-3 subunit beta|nr:DNA polymerase III subunit beta [Puniceicoccales bacterium]
MKFKIHRDHFAAGLAQVQNIVGSRSTMPILSNVLIEAEGDTIALTTTNLDLGTSLRIKAEVSTSGRITLPVRKLLAMVKSLSSVETTVEFGGQNRVKITSGSSTFHIVGLGAESFPPLPVFDDKHTFSLVKADLTNLLKKVSYAQSTDENRYVLNGIFFNFADEKLTLVATDGRRLATADKPVALTAEQAGSLILPAKTVIELQRLLDTKIGDGEIRIVFNDRQVSFITPVTKDDSGLTGDIRLVSKVVEGSYPNYRQVVPKETAYRIEIERGTLSESIYRSSITTSDKSSSIKLKITNNEVEITSSAEIGESKEKLDVSYEGPEVQIAFNPQYLKDPLDALDDDMVYFEFKDEMSPGVVKTKENFLCVIMPQRVP